MYMYVCTFPSTPGEDPEELEVYGTDTSTGPLIASYKFEVEWLE